MSRLLCWLGIHHWWYDDVSPGSNYKYRRCRACNAKQYAYRGGFMSSWSRWRRNT